MSWRRLLAAGLTAAALTGLAGGAFELWRFGPTDADATARVEAQVRRAFESMSKTLAEVAGHVATDPSAPAALATGSDEARRLFDLVAAARARSPVPDQVSVTVYDTQGLARAWVGRPSENAPADRLSKTAAFFLAPSPLGLRLLHARPILGDDDRRLGSVVAEHVVSPRGPSVTASTDFRMATAIVPVSLRPRWQGAGDRPRPGAFLLHDPSGDPLIEASVSSAELRDTRMAWRRTVVGAVIAVAGVTLLILVGPLLDRRARTSQRWQFLQTTTLSGALVLGGAATIWVGLFVSEAHAPAAAVTFFLAGSTAAALAALAAGPVARLRLLFRHVRRPPTDAPARFALVQVAAGVVVAAVIVLFEWVLDAAVDPTSVDLRHFSLHPWNGTRILLLFGILALHVAVLWTATLTLAAAPAAWRVPRRARRGRILLLTLWLTPVALGAALAAAEAWPLPAGGMLGSAAACGVAALFAHRIAAWYRHTTVAARILALFVAFLVPALLLYSSLDFFARRATERLITSRFAVEARNHSQELQDRLAQARAEIDALTTLPGLVSEDVLTEERTPSTDSAFLVWNQTALATSRLTSAVELYDREGGLVSRFALNLPEYTGVVQKPQLPPDCRWEVFGEALPFGSEERRMLHAERAICRDDGNGPTPIGSIVVHVASDYRTLPFISSQSPYFEIFRPSENGAPREGTPGGRVEIAIYGWGLRPIYTSGRLAWPIGDALFDRIYASRDPFWETINHAGETYRVHFSNDRQGIYAIGYPTVGLFDHLVHLAELTTLGGASFGLVLIGTALFTRASRERPRVGRALLREIRASFYRKLFLAFVLASTIPVLTLALVIRAYFADRLHNDVLAEGARTAAVAQRVIQESDALQRQAAGGPSPVSDDVMVWISQVIDQDVNIFDGPRLIATSERDLFASGLLPTRTPYDVYRAIALDHLPSFVDEDLIGTYPYLVAAAPVQAVAPDAILTVPLAPRQREIDRETDELDRSIHLAVLVFVLLGAGIGLSLAERIADPVKRLTRATRRIARGDFDARIAVKSADELKRLVEAFNSMAVELKEQRVQLERTHRLEAWAEMARQVAHEIKNPLTPIQLSAEHLRRVHADRGEPLGPVLDSCVASILGQVRLLRQIAAEFSSFASSPIARPAPVDVPDLVAVVVDPYRTGLSGRIEIENGVTGPLPLVQVDRTLIARALANIVENALHAMPSHGRLDIDAGVENGFVTLRVRDTGAGMDDEALARVFEPYFSTKATGTGLGLPIARRNVELSGGTIEVESVKGLGTTVFVRLPLAERD